MFTFIPESGLDTTTGQPHPITKRMSIRGRIVAGRVETGKNVVVGGKRTMRKFCLGMSVAQFNELMNYITLENEN